MLFCIAGFTPPASARPVIPSAACAEPVSETLLIRELGVGLNAVAVECNMVDRAGFQNATTNTNGRVCFSVAVGTAVDVRVDDMHEGAAGEATRTASGTHFALGGP